MVDVLGNLFSLFCSTWRLVLKMFVRFFRIKASESLSDINDTLACATFLFLPHFEVICDLLLNRRTAKWNLFGKQN